MNVQEIIKDAKHRMEMSVEATSRDFAAIRTGRANPQILNRIHVEYYGVETPLPQLATITVPEAQQLLIQPYDKSLIPAIERAILKSDLGIHPSTDSGGIRLKFPAMTEERNSSSKSIIAPRKDASPCVTFEETPSNTSKKRKKKNRFPKTNSNDTNTKSKN